MALKYWVGGGTNTNWNSSPTTNWANSSGGAGNQTAPAAGDSVFFDGSSGTGASVWNTSISLATLDCTLSKNVITHNGSVTFTLSSGNLVLPTGVGGTYTASTSSALFTFTATSGTQAITTNTFAPGSMTFNGLGGTFQLQDNLTLLASATATVTLTTGTFDAQAFTVTAGKFVGNGSAVRALVGSGLWTLGGTTATGTIWNTASIGSFTVTAFTSNITIVAVSTLTARVFAGGNIVLAGTVTVGANSGGGSFEITGNNTFGNFAPSGPNLFILPSPAGSLTLSNAPTIAGASGSEIGFVTASTNSACTISVASGTASFSWCAFRDITGSGGATFTATDSFDLGHNTTITINPPGGAGTTLSTAGVIGS